MRLDAGPLAPVDAKRSRRATTLTGIGIMAAMGEIVVQQRLGWHHFCDG